MGQTITWSLIPLTALVQSLLLPTSGHINGVDVDVTGKKGIVPLL